MWHVHAPDLAALATGHPDTRLVAVWDDDPASAREAAGRFGVPAVADLASVLSRDDVDAVMVTTATDRHEHVIGAAARAGRHVFTEKLLATTVEGCRRIVAEVDRAGVALGVALPRLADGAVAAIRQEISAGSVGEVTLVRVRLSHDGATGLRWSLPDRFYDPVALGGGAFADLGAHPAYLTMELLGGLPERVSATYSHVTRRAVEDNAVVVTRYPSGAIGVAETGFVGWSDLSLEVHGTAASLVHTGHDGVVRRVAPGPGLTTVVTEIDVPPAGPSPFETWVQQILTGSRSSSGASRAVDLTRLVEAANRSAHTGREIILTRHGEDGGEDEVAA
jgi:predicted dehydrogenase